MDFAVMGTISSYVKRQNLTFAAKHKMRTGQTLVDSNGNLTFTNAVSTFDKLREASKTSNSQAKAQKLARIKQKLRDGQKLSDEELGFLRVNDPKTYKKAKAVDDAREELKSELKKAKSKSEAREAMSRAMVKASSGAMAELSALGQGGATCAGGSFNGAAMPANDTSVSNAAMTAGGDASANVGGEISATDANCQSSNDFGTENNQSTLGTQKNSDADKNTPEDIMEKYIWTIRALQDEWMHFTSSDDYKELPNQIADEIISKKTVRTNRRSLDAALAYRKSMTLTKNPT